MRLGEHRPMRNLLFKVFELEAIMKIATSPHTDVASKGLAVAIPKVMACGFSAVLLIAVGEGLWLFRLQSDVSVYRTIIAGATKADIEAHFGSSRFKAALGERLSETGWNGAEADRIVDRPCSVYSASPWLFVVCEFDGNGNLWRATISPK